MVHINGFCVIRPSGRPMITETFATDEAAAICRFDFKNYSNQLWKDCLKEGYRIGKVSISVEEKEPIAMEEKLEAFKLAIIKAHAAFAKSKKKLSDLSPRFWVAWMDLEMVMEFQAPFDEIKAEFQKSRKQFGSPGDFGYGTLCGDCLKAVYDAWGAVVAESAKKPMAHGVEVEAELQ